MKQHRLGYTIALSLIFLVSCGSEEGSETKTKTKFLTRSSIDASSSLPGFAQASVKGTLTSCGAPVDVTFDVVSASRTFTFYFSGASAEIGKVYGMSLPFRETSVGAILLAQDAKGELASDTEGDPVAFGMRFNQLELRAGGVFSVSFNARMARGETLSGTVVGNLEDGGGCEQGQAVRVEGYDFFGDKLTCWPRPKELEFPAGFTGEMPQEIRENNRRFEQACRNLGHLLTSCGFGIPLCSGPVPGFKL